MKFSEHANKIKCVETILDSSTESINDLNLSMGLIKSQTEKHVSKLDDRMDTFASNYRIQKTNLNDLSRKASELSSIINSIKEPNDATLAAIKSEVKRVKQISSTTQDGIASINKNNASLSSDLGKLRSRFAILEKRINELALSSASWSSIVKPREERDIAGGANPNRQQRHPPETPHTINQSTMTDESTEITPPLRTDSPTSNARTAQPIDRPRSPRIITTIITTRAPPTQRKAHYTDHYAPAGDDFIEVRNFSHSRLFYVGNIGEEGTLDKIHSYLHRRYVVPLQLRIIQSRQTGLHAAKIRIHIDDTPVILQRGFWPDGVYVRQWIQRN